jgi:hypothetical protein
MCTLKPALSSRACPFKRCSQPSSLLQVQTRLNADTSANVTQAISVLLAEGAVDHATPLLRHCVSTFHADLSTCGPPESTSGLDTDLDTPLSATEVVERLLELLPLFSKTANALQDMRLAGEAFALAHKHMPPNHPEFAKVWDSG